MKTKRVLLVISVFFISINCISNKGTKDDSSGKPNNLEQDMQNENKIS